MERMFSYLNCRFYYRNLSMRLSCIRRVYVPELDIVKLN